MPSRDPAGRVDDILDSISRIESYIAKAGGIEALLAANDELYDGVERRLMIVWEAAVKLGALAEHLEPEMAWRDIRGLDNALRHAYSDLNHDVIRAILAFHLGPLASACLLIKAKLLH